jgi:hypothetical protein
MMLCGVVCRAVCVTNIRFLSQWCQKVPSGASRTEESINTHSSRLFLSRRQKEAVYFSVRDETRTWRILGDDG